MAVKRMTLKRIAPKKHFLVFCTIFLALVVLLGLGAWHTHAEIERHAAERNDAPSPESDAPPAPPLIRRLADPPPSPEG